MTHRFNHVLFMILISAALLCFASRMASPCFADGKTGESDRAMPLVLPEQTSAEIKSVQDRIYRLALHQAHYVLTLVHPWKEDPRLKLATESKSTEHFIRPNSAIIAGLAFLYRFGPYDEKIVGVSRAELLEQYIIPMLRYVTTTHLTGTRPTSDGKKWGKQWQSAYWAQMAGRPAWWIWDDLPNDLCESVRRMVAFEAERFVDQKPPHNLTDDTKAEENAWNSLSLNVAMLLMPSDSRRPVWEKEFQRWALSAYLRPADERSATMVDGRPLSEQFGGANLYDDFTLENHRRVHPDYMGCFTMTLSATTDYDLTSRRPPEALLHNTREIYQNLKWFYLPDGGCIYPNGQDWALFHNSYNASFLHSLMAAYAQDPDAWSLLKTCLTTGEKMQARDPRGAIFTEEEIVYPGSQHAAGLQMAQTWLTLQTAKQIVDRPQPLLGVKRLDSGKIILHRTPKAVHTFSWGPVVMAQCVPWRLDRVVSPHQRDGIGQIRLKNETENLPLKVVSVDVQDSADGFTADLTLDHGDAVRAELQFHSRADGAFDIREKLAALRDITTARISTGLIGVLNNPKWIHESHHRKIEFDSQTADIPCLSGKKLESAGVRHIDVDGALRIESRTPLSAHYQGAKKIDRGRATDLLYLNYLDGERNWTRGQVISTYKATLTPLVEPPKNP
jgi:hypothetical protein